MTNPDLDALEADLKRQLDRTRRIPSEPLISIAADTMRALIAQAREVATLTAERDAIEDMAENVIIAYGMGLGLDEAIANLGAAVDMEVKPRGSIPGAEDVLTEHIRALTAERDALEACVELRETGLANALRELHEAEQQRDALKAERDAARAAAREAFADDMPPKLVDAIKELVQHSTQQLHTLVALKEAEENVAALTAKRDALKAERDEIRRLLVKEDKAHERTIGERDEAQECVSNIYFMMTGRSPEWSNNFGYEQCLEELREMRQLLGDATRKAEATLATRDEQIAALKAALEAAREFVDEEKERRSYVVTEFSPDPYTDEPDKVLAVIDAALDALTANARSE